MPATPARFSTMTGTSSRLASSAATSRPATSAPPPGTEGTMSVIGRSG